MKQLFGILIDVCTVFFLMGVVGVVVSFSMMVVLDIPATVTFQFMSGFLIGTFTILALALMIIWRKQK